VSFLSGLFGSPQEEPNGLPAEFFKAVRPAFGKLTEGQVDGLTRIVGACRKAGLSRPDTAYVLATVQHETANWMQPIREGARRYGTKYTDAQARRAVASIHGKGIIRVNYALPDGPYRQSYYGRGLVQITWLANYAKFAKRLGVDFVQFPDKTLEWAHALDILIIGMTEGMFTKYSLAEVPDVMKSPAFDNTDRLIINGDAKKNGPAISGLAGTYWHALEHVYGK
jgi:hypothetical protein